MPFVYYSCPDLIIALSILSGIVLACHGHINTTENWASGFSTWMVEDSILLLTVCLLLWLWLLCCPLSRIKDNNNNNSNSDSYY